MPHIPQLLEFSCRLTQTPPQNEKPAAQVSVTSGAPASGDGDAQRPATQLCPLAQPFPQAPQWEALTLVSTQNMPQSVRPDGHTPPSMPVTAPAHVPPPHVCPGKHARPQPPQLLVSRETSTQAPPHAICPLGQRGPASPGVTAPSGDTLPSMLLSIAHAPITQTRPVGHARPQPPQWSGLVIGSMHALPHGIIPTPQLPPSGVAPPSGGTMSGDCGSPAHAARATTRRLVKTAKRIVTGSLRCAS